MRIYEGMFLLDSAQASQDLDELKAKFLGVLERYGAKVVKDGVWDERKLAYPIKKQRRGTYYLAYFEADPQSLVQIRADLQLTPGVLRFLFLVVPEDVPVPEEIAVPKPPADEDFKIRRGGDRRDKGFKRYSKHRCRFSRLNIKYLDWKETHTLSRLSTSQGKMFSRKRSGNCARHQRQLKRAMKYARFMGLAPYVAR